MLAGVLCILHAAASAQGSRRRVRVGLLLHGTPATYVRAAAAVRDGLAERGYAEPGSLELVIRHSDGVPERLPAIARELVALPVDVIVTSSTPAIRAAMDATKTIPIVFFAVADAIGSGLVASLARPGGNVTGLTLLIPDLGAKQVELLAGLVPGLRRITVLRGRGEGAQAFESIAAAVGAQGIDATFVELVSPDDMAPAFAAMQASRSQAVIVVDGPLLNNFDARLATLATVYRLPMISTLRRYVDAGSLASYGPDVNAMARRAATHYVDRIIKGARPTDLPVEQPTKFEFVVNLKAGKALGLAVPRSVLARADEVIE
jgi:putative ABC transport system substrate-binding protein